MIKDKLDSCADNSNNIKDENTPNCDSTSKDSGGNDSKKEEDAGSSSGTPTTKESPGSRSNPSSTPTRPTNCTPNANSNNSTPCPPAEPEIANMLDNGPQPPPDISGTTPPHEEPVERALPPDLQSETFNELIPPVVPVRGMNVPGMHGIRASPNGILNSNIINKPTGPPQAPQNPNGTGTNMEVQYMQQQSQIFVFSTMLANKSAEAVSQGHFQSIIAYHCAQPGTKKYFEKHPLKLTQFNRQSPAQWLNGLAMMKNKGCARGGMPPGNMPPQMQQQMHPMGGKPPPQQGPPMGMVDPFPGHDAIVDDIANTLQDADVPWEQQRAPSGPHPIQMTPTGNGPPNPVQPPGPELPDGPVLDDGPGGILGHSPCIPSSGPPTSPSLLEPSLQGVKIPDEDLTPQQRKHREEQLATLAKMKYMLFPEENTTGIDEHEMVPNPDVPPCPGNIISSGHMEWQKLQNQFYDSKVNTKETPRPPAPNQSSPQVGANGNGPPRLQGPPPPYHQTPRSASVPIALQSPSPASPNNPTSNLSLPSPRTSSALNSPAGPQQPPSFARHFNSTQSPTSQNSPSAPPRGAQSNPGTPISSHFSPSGPPTEGITTQPGDFQGNAPVVTSSHHGVDGMFCRTLQSIAQKQHMVSGVPGGPGSTDMSTSPNKEPNLMPVPSPQQIQYCNTFEGQELTIQKQPNTSLNKDRNITSPASLDSGFPGEMCSGGQNARSSAPNTPSSVDMTPRFPPNDCYRLPAPSPTDSKNPRPSPQNQASRPTDRFGNASPLYPPMMGVGSPNPFPKSNMMAVSPKSEPRADNVPLNPNNNTVNTKGSHFDPISSLAQMSQLLTSTSSMNGQPPPGPSMMPYGGVNASPMDMNRPEHCIPDMDPGMMMGGPPAPHLYNPGMGSPKNMPFMSPQRIMTRPQMGQMPPYNGTNVQVKASAPNTIQYLPARPQMGPQNPRGPPSLDFLRFANQDQNRQYFPGCQMENMHNDNLMNLMNGPMMGKMGMMPQGMMPHGMRPPNPGMPRPPMQNPQMQNQIRMHMGFDPMGQEQMYPPPGGGGGPPQMFPGKGPRGMCAPDASQPLPPSVGQANAYKSSPFGGATTADPNYAQQFHNFQQQLYATSTRSQLNSQGPGPPGPQSQSAPTSNHMYFMSK